MGKLCQQVLRAAVAVGVRVGGFSNRKPLVCIVVDKSANHTLTYKRGGKEAQKQVGGGGVSPTKTVTVGKSGALLPWNSGNSRGVQHCGQLKALDKGRAMAPQKEGYQERIIGFYYITSNL